MKRVCLYLEEDVWTALRTRARSEHTTVSILVRTAVREKYLPNQSQRRAAMLSAVGIWKDRTDLPDTETYVRELRKGDRLKRFLR